MPPSPDHWSILVDVGGVILREDEGCAARFAAIRQVLDRLGLLRHFTHVEVSGDLGLAKPDTRFLDHVLRRCGGSPPPDRGAR